MENEFIDRLNKILEVKKPNSKYLSKVKYEKLIIHLKELKTKKPKIPNDYRIIKKYDVVEVSNVERLVVPKMNKDDQIKCYVFNEELFSILHETHLSIGHGRRDRMEHQLHSKYENITRETVMLYLNLCELCQKKSFMIKPITSTDNINLHYQDLVDIHTI
ncbi:Hypothetical protein CINCED_3A014936 [Cinara cedri]|uniref:Uncharacterized protein n=1 Tax=Cinara cedri TaxID=506608 RepID=A0A5E4MY55_9HEMI|nr:Hypothetical protein CINCED_3A014936 [Cinara cedri]